MSVVNKYYKRALEDVIIKSFSNNKIVSILGARQCGKSTIIEHIFPNIEITHLHPGGPSTHTMAVALMSRQP